MDVQLRITETFLSLQGEALTSGYPTWFIRLTGCPLRCTYCDTAYAFHGGTRRSIAELVDEARAAQVAHVTVTGGEPLAQAGCVQLLEELLAAGLGVSLETSGALSIEGLPPEVSVVLDLKTPASGELARNRMENIATLQANDQVKFVICDRADYEWSRLQLDELHLEERVGCVWFSPVAPGLDPRQLADWMVQDRPAARLQLQLHKILWGDQPGR